MRLGVKRQIAPDDLAAALAGMGELAPHFLASDRPPRAAPVSARPKAPDAGAGPKLNVPAIFPAIVGIMRKRVAGSPRRQFKD